MRFVLFVFLLIFSFNVSAQTPAVAQLFAEGTRAANAGRFGDALTSYRTALFMGENERLDNNYLSRVRYNIGVCYFHLDQPRLAAIELKLAVRLNHGEYTRALYALGMADMQMKNWKAAAASFGKVLKSEPRNGEAWFDLAFASVADGDLEAAEKAFANSIAFGSVDSALSHNNIGVILAVRGDLAGAETEFVTAIEKSDGRLHEAKRNLEFCRRLGKTKLVATDLRYAMRSAAVNVS